MEDSEVPVVVMMKRVKRTRPPSAYNLFLKEFILNLDPKGKPQQNLRVGAKAWQLQKNSSTES